MSNLPVSPGDSAPRRWGRSVLRYGPPTTFPVVASVTALVAGVNHGSVRVYWSIAAVAATAGTAIFNALKERQSRASVSAAATGRTELGRALAVAGEPLVTALGTLTAGRNSEDRRAALETLRHLTVQVAAARCGRDVPNKDRGQIRSSYYELNGDKLERRSFSGRRANRPPRKDFQRGRSDHDDEALKVASGDGVLLVEDLEKNRPPWFNFNHDTSYRTFITVPVKAGDHSFGLLSIDSDKPHSLTDVDRGFTILLAGLLAAGLAHTSSDGGQPADPTHAGQIPNQPGPANDEGSNQPIQ